MNGQRFAIMPIASSFRARSKPSDVNQKTPASARQKRCRALRARGGDAIPLQHGAASTDTQLCRSSFKLVYLSRLAAFLPALCTASVALSSRLPLTAFPERWDDFGMLMNAVRWVREAVFEVPLRSRSRPNQFVGWHKVQIVSILPSSRGQPYMKFSLWWSAY